MQSSKTVVYIQEHNTRQEYIIYWLDSCKEHYINSDHLSFTIITCVVHIITLILIMFFQPHTSSRGLVSTQLLSNLGYPFGSCSLVECSRFDQTSVKHCCECSRRWQDAVLTLNTCWGEEKQELLGFLRRERVWRICKQHRRINTSGKVLIIIQKNRHILPW